MITLAIGFVLGVAFGWVIASAGQRFWMNVARDLLEKENGNGKGS